MHRAPRDAGLRVPVARQPGEVLASLAVVVPLAEAAACRLVGQVCGAQRRYAEEDLFHLELEREFVDVIGELDVGEQGGRGHRPFHAARQLEQVLHAGDGLRAVRGVASGVGGAELHDLPRGARLVLDVLDQVAISVVAFAVRSASLRTSSATTAKLRPRVAGARSPIAALRAKQVGLVGDLP